jgi:trans-L-3-hydroxyproline dehydratase
MKAGFLFDNMHWQVPKDWWAIKSFDLHTGGEPLRILTHGLPEIKGKTILEKRKYFKENYDFIRTGTMLEPRGHADMYGAVITEPTTENADFGTFFLHNEGYSTMCGHAIIALVKLVLDAKLIYKQGSRPEIIIDAPPGQIIARAELVNGMVNKVRFINVPSFVLYNRQTVHVEGTGNVVFDIAYGGAFYAICNARQFGFKLVPEEFDQLIDIGRKIKYAIMNKFNIKHPFEEDLGFLYGTIFTGPPMGDRSRHSRNVCIFANGEVDRSATGSGVSARAALHHIRNELKNNERIIIESILGTTMEVEITGTTKYGPYEAVIPEVSGTAYIIGQNAFYFDPNDPLKKGFIFR